MEEKNLNVIIAHTPRVTDNKLLNFALENKSKVNLIIYCSDHASMDFPFLVKEQRVSRYDLMKKVIFKEFADHLSQFLKCSIAFTQEELKSALISAPICMDYRFDHYFDQFLIALKQNYQIKFFSHQSHFAQKEQVDLVLKKKMGFTPFRKMMEPKVYETHVFKAGILPAKSESQALNKINQYFLSGKALHYFETRNSFHYNEGPSNFSIPLSLGLVSPRSILEIIKDYELIHGENKSTYWLRFELLWREYFYWLYGMHGLDFFSLNGLSHQKNLRIDVISLITLEESLKKNPLIYCMIKELKSEGVLSNRCRQIFASYFINHLDYDWRYGAYLFQLYLKDYDLASNWGNWTYLAGVGTDPRGKRYFDIQKQIAQYDPQNSYLSRWSKL